MGESIKKAPSSPYKAPEIVFRYCTYPRPVSGAFLRQTGYIYIILNNTPYVGYGGYGGCISAGRSPHMPIKTGTVAIFKEVSKICATIKRYDAKIRIVVASAHSAGAITDAQYAQAIAFLDGAGAICVIFGIITGY